jgi:hypothetical protein
MRIVVALALLLFTGSCSTWEVRPLQARELEAVSAAEAFIVRHGYTIAGHPSDQPVQNVEVLDDLATPDELVGWRRATLEPHAFGVTRESDGDYCYVLFHRLNDPDAAFRAVLVQGGKPVQVVHSVLRLDGLRWVRVPPH